jgi:hypothetical protein
MELKDCNLGRQAAAPPESGWAPLKEFIRYAYGKAETPSRLPQEPARAPVDSKRAIEALAQRPLQSSV